MAATVQGVNELANQYSPFSSLAKMCTKIFGEMCNISEFQFFFPCFSSSNVECKWIGILMSFEKNIDLLNNKRRKKKKYTVNLETDVSGMSGIVEL
jgi:hypothetical protein